MNGYLLRKLRSEQQLMNELTKLLVSKDYTSKKMSELLKELAFFYVSPTGAKLPHSVLKDLCALLIHLKDKKDDLRIAKLVLCYLGRILDQFELRLHQVTLMNDPALRTQSFEISSTLVTSLMKLIETSELNHLSLPRQHTCLKLYGYLCRLFNKADQLIHRIEPMLVKSSVWTLYSAHDKKQISAIYGKKDFITSLAQLGAAFHCLRYYVPLDDPTPTFLESLLQAIFLPISSVSHPVASMTHATASRHAAATLLQYFEQGNAQAKVVVQQFEIFMTRVRPTTLIMGKDALTTIYLLRFCGQLRRLPVTEQPSPQPNRDTGSFSSSLLDFSFDPSISSPLSPSNSPSPPPSPIARQRQRVQGVNISHSLSVRLNDLLLDVITNPDVPTSILMVAIEQLIQEATANALNEKVRVSSPGTVFELVANVLIKVLQQATTNEMVLHRVLRTIQSTAQALDGALLQQSSGGSYNFLFIDRLIELIMECSSKNPFIQTQCLHALIWLIPRVNGKWTWLITKLLSIADHDQDQDIHSLSPEQISPLERHQLAEALYYRAVIHPSLYSSNKTMIDSEMLRNGLQVTLIWFQMYPCSWHASMLTKMWSIGLRKSMESLGNDVFHSVNAVLDTHHSLSSQLVAINQVHQATLEFMIRCGSLYIVQQQSNESQSWFTAFTVRLTKQLLLESCLSRRLTVQVLHALYKHAQERGKSEIMNYVTSLFQYLRGTSESKINFQMLNDTLGISDVIDKSIESRPSSTTTREGPVAF